MPFNMFPYSNLHNLNLDWILAQIKSTETLVELFRGELAGITLRLNQLDTLAQQLSADSVRYTAQAQTAERQQQARSNIGAASSTDLQRLEELVEQAQDAVLYNANNTISTAPNQLTVRGANEGDYSVLGGGFLRLYEALSGAGVFLTCDPDSGSLRVGPVGLPGGRARISNVDDPADGSDAVNKDYVDDQLLILTPLKIRFSGRTSSNNARCDTPFATIASALNSGRPVEALYDAADYTVSMPIFSNGLQSQTPYIACHTLTYADNRFYVTRAYMTANNVTITMGYVGANAYTS